MWVDVIDLREFYGSNLGRSTERILSQRLRQFWPDVKNETILGLGYAPPLLTSFMGHGNRLIAAMPAQQGVLSWEGGMGSQTTLVDEFMLPLPDLSVDRALLVHALECADHVRALLREVWRVLSGSGRLIILVPNRSGLWSIFERTPFGHGKPYSAGQLSRLLRDNQFSPMDTSHALFMPPFRSRLMTRSAPTWERSRGWITDAFAGVVIIEAVKQIYAATPVTQTRRLGAYLPFPEPSRVRGST